MKPPFQNGIIFISLFYFLVFVLVTQATTTTAINAGDVSENIISIDGFNATEAVVVIPRDDEIHVCSDEDDENDFTMSRKCTCADNTFKCRSYLQRVNRTDFIILKSNFTVKIVDFSFNSIKSLKKDKILPGHEKTIEDLDFEFSHIETIENGTFDKFVSLKNLNLAHSNIKILHEGIFTQKLGKTLKKLDLSGNSLKFISFENLRNLNELNLYHNNLSLLVGGSNSTQASKGLSNLTILDCYYCGISNLSDDFFVNLKNLQKLRLVGYSVTSIPKGLGALTNLQELTIYETEIINIDDCAFCGLINLKKLNLEYNRHLNFIHENAFGFAEENGTSLSLRDFSIENCNISILPEKLLNWNEKGLNMKINQNPFTCNCSMAWLINDLQSNCSVFAQKIELHEFSSYYKNHNVRQLRCHNSPFIHIPFIYLHKYHKAFCNSTEIGYGIHGCPEKKIIPSPSFFTRHWFLIIFIVFAIIGGGSIAGIYFYRNRIIAVPYQRRSEEEDIIEEDFDSN